MNIDYSHKCNRHSVDGARSALPLLVGLSHPQSLLDVGCGTGTWLRAALDLGINDVLGVDGIELPDDQFLIPKSLFRRVDLTAEWKLGRRFDLAICLEVVEHLRPTAAELVVKCLTLHAHKILFSAACPGQEGQGHLNCQWADYWQAFFNSLGFWCDDSPRWTIWDKEEVEPWYRQNLFIAARDKSRAGKEPRIKRVLHPAMFAGSVMPNMSKTRREIIHQTEQGSQSLGWYVSIPFRGVFAKVRRVGKTRE